MDDGVGDDDDDDDDDREHVGVGDTIDHRHHHHQHHSHDRRENRDPQRSRPRFTTPTTTRAKPPTTQNVCVKYRPKLRLLMSKRKFSELAQSYGLVQSSEIQRSIEDNTMRLKQAKSMLKAAMDEIKELEEMCNREESTCRCTISCKVSALEDGALKEAAVYEKRRKEHVAAYCALRKKWRLTRELEDIYRRDLWFFEENARRLYHAAQAYLDE